MVQEKDRAVPTKREDVSIAVRCVASAVKRCGSSVWEFTFYAAAFLKAVGVDIEVEATKFMRFSVGWSPMDPAYKVPDFMLEFAKKAHEQTDPKGFFQGLRASRCPFRL